MCLLDGHSSLCGSGPALFQCLFTLFENFPFHSGSQGGQQNKHKNNPTVKSEVTVDNRINRLHQDVVMESR